MPRAKKETTVSDKGGWKGFVDARLTAEEKTRFRNWDFSYEAAWGRMMGLLDDGYKVSLSYEPKQGFLACSLTGKAETGKNAGYCMVSRAKSVEDAIRLAIFKHDVVYEGDWATIANRPDDGDEIE